MEAASHTPVPAPQPGQPGQPPQVSNLPNGFQLNPEGNSASKVVTILKDGIDSKYVVTIRFPSKTTPQQINKLLERYNKEATNQVVGNLVELGLGRSSKPREGQEEKRAIVAMQLKRGDDGQFAVTKRYKQGENDSRDEEKIISKEHYEAKSALLKPGEDPRKYDLKLRKLEVLNNLMLDSGIGTSPKPANKPNAPATPAAPSNSPINPKPPATTPAIPKPPAITAAKPQPDQTATVQKSPFAFPASKPSVQHQFNPQQALPTLPTPLPVSTGIPQANPQPPNAGPDAVVIDMGPASPEALTLEEVAIEKKPIADKPSSFDWKSYADKKYPNDPNKKASFLEAMRTASQNLNTGKINPVGNVSEFNYMALSLFENPNSPYQVVLDVNDLSSNGANLPFTKTKILCGAIELADSLDGIRESAKTTAQKIMDANVNTKLPLSKIFIPYIVPGNPSGMLVIIELPESSKNPPNVTIIDPVGFELSAYKKQQEAIAQGLTQVYQRTKGDFAPGIMYNHHKQEQDQVVAGARYHNLMYLDEFKNENDIQTKVYHQKLNKHDVQSWVDQKIKPKLAEDSLKPNP
jgi:hypothetical protein